jgi:TolB protein
MQIRSLLSVGLAVCVALLLSACGGGGNPRPDLALVSTRDGDYAIYAMNADGGRQKRLTKAKIDTSSPAGLFFQIDPAWSPDGATIAFASKRAGTFDIYVMRADGTGTRRLTSTRGDDTHPTWSPDGEQLAFERTDDIYAMSADGNRVHLISAGPASDGNPAWSPDGRWIAFVRKTPGTEVRELWLVRPDGSLQHRLTSLQAMSLSPAWSPDSKRIAFATDVVGQLFDIYVVGVDGKGIRRLTRSGPSAFEPAWSPDGKTLAFSRDGSIVTTDLSGHENELTNSKNND